jgi:hypothetical protein
MPTPKPSCKGRLLVTTREVPSCAHFGHLGTKFGGKSLRDIREYGMET